MPYCLIKCVAPIVSSPRHPLYFAAFLLIITVLSRSLKRLYTLLLALVGCVWTVNNKSTEFDVCNIIFIGCILLDIRHRSKINIIIVWIQHHHLRQKVWSLQSVIFFSRISLHRSTKALTFSQYADETLCLVRQTSYTQDWNASDTSDAAIFDKQVYDSHQIEL